MFYKYCNIITVIFYFIFFLLYLSPKSRWILCMTVCYVTVCYILLLLLSIVCKDHNNFYLCVDALVVNHRLWTTKIRNYSWIYFQLILSWFQISRPIKQINGARLTTTSRQAVNARLLYFYSINWIYIFHIYKMHAVPICLWNYTWRLIIRDKTTYNVIDCTWFVYINGM